MKAYLITDSKLNAFEGGMFSLVIADKPAKAKSEDMFNKMDQYADDSRFDYLRTKRIPECDYLSNETQTTITYWDLYKKHGLCGNCFCEIDECETCKYKTKCKNYQGEICRD